MAVSIAMPQQQEAGFDKFLRRATGVANIAKGGLDAYQGFTDFRDKQQLLGDKNSGVRRAEDVDMNQFQQAADDDASAEEFKIREGDNVVTRKFKKRLAEAKAVNPLDEELTKAKIQQIKSETAKNYRENQGNESDLFKKLNPLDQELAKDLTKKNASKVSIKNQIDSVLNGWDKLDEDQRIISGRQLLKTLNSTEGADAIGSEEAKRLGGLLEFQMFNVRNPGPLFGRDVEGFKTQAGNISQAIGGAIEANQKQIQGITGNLSGRGLSDLVASKPPKDAYKNMSGGKDPVIGARGFPEQPKTVTQNGVKFVLNEKTGQYEPKK